MKQFNEMFNLIGIQGFNMRIDENGDAETNYTILSFTEDSPQDVVPVGYFTANVQGDMPVS